MRVFTTGQVAKICKVAPRTVSKWFDSGRLKGYRIPGSQDRRIPEDKLIAFLKAHGMPYEQLLLMSLQRILLVSQDEILAEILVERFPDSDGVIVKHANSGFEAGLICRDFHPQFVVVDFAIGQADARSLCTNLSRPDLAFECQLLVILRGSAKSLRPALEKRGISDIFTAPFDMEDFCASLAASMNGKNKMRKSA